MPITLAPSRRQFLAGSLAVAVGLLAKRYSFALPDGADPNRFALLSDVHINANPAQANLNVNMTDHLTRAVADVLKLEGAPPANVFISGDLAHVDGQPGDYQQLLKLLDPLAKAGMPIHMALGNHDARPAFWSELPNTVYTPGHRVEAIAAHQVLAVDTPNARWIVLDTLEKTLQSSGLLGAQQLEWLTKTLDTQPDRTTLIVLHHNPLRQPATAPATQPTTRPKFSALKDTQALYDIVLPRKQVKAIFYGHTHWHEFKQEAGLHLVNLPPVSYVFNKDEPCAWMDCRVKSDSMELALHCVAPHAKDGRKTTLAWR